MGNQNPYIEDEQTTQWPKEEVQKDKQRSTTHTYKPKDRVTRTPLKTGGELRCLSDDALHSSNLHPIRYSKGPPHEDTVCPEKDTNPSEVTMSSS